MHHWGQSLEHVQMYPQGVWTSVVLEHMEWSAEHVSLHVQHAMQPVNIQAKLVIGADGAQSWVREQTGVAVEVVPYAHHALVGCFETEHSHGGIAYQWFKKNGDIMAWLPMPHGVGVVWSHTPSEITSDRTTILNDPQRIADELSQYGHQRLGQWRYQGGLAIFPLSMQYLKSALPSRIMLMGDARQRVHPLAGQGLNLGLIEARQCVEAIQAFPLNDPGHPWISARITQKESLAQRVMPWGIDAFWRMNQPGCMPQPFQKLLGFGWRGFHQSGMLKRVVSRMISI